ncbi:hypothetical protein FEM48_Zijuj07G0079500 [Ziziphus jujuba var. spinosa]|uniref:F-box domain-containing protein n=1 Tax=Ziziphus jujuba var. spinosa TaxID=714518 RepID=A0A978V3F3_ZIZJJ|nr:putative F-box protein At4g17565 [Ziziphus jujuba var. spinosa]KAH7521886.1 hypothetical protein FEM48_Zijuj07G0079500 [Ziziphus jujuba var. spinosa]
MASNWSNLQCELLELILKRLAIVDTIRFKAVCSSWYTAAKSYTSFPNSYKAQTPWLMLRSHDGEDDPDARCFFSISDDKFYKINVFEGFLDALCIGSSYGWLLVLDQNANLHVLNPFSLKFKMQLPLINTLIKSPYLKEFRKHYIFKAILLSDPFRNKTFSVVMMYGPLSRRRLAFCRYGDKAWSRLGSQNRTYYNFYKDIICCNGFLYALSCSGQVEIWDFKTNFPEKILDVEFSRTVRRSVKEHADYLFAKYHLVESMGEVLFVLELMGEIDDFWSIGTIGFAIYKMDSCGNRWLKVENLSDRAIFVDRNECVLISTKDFPQVRENSIYFRNYLNGGRKNIGVYNLIEKKIVGKADHHYIHIILSSICIVPNPW